MITIAIGINANGAAVFKNITARKTPSALEPRLALASVYYHTHEDAKALALLDRADATARQINSWEHIVEVHHLYFQLKSTSFQ